MTDADTATVEQTVRISARPETVWRYWTDAQRMCDWWGAAAELDPRPGGTCRVDMGGGTVMIGAYLELVPHERVVFSFGWEPHEGVPAVPPCSTRVEVILIDDDGDTIMTLRHTGLSAELAEQHRSGWENILPQLERAVS